MSNGMEQGRLSQRSSVRLRPPQMNFLTAKTADATGSGISCDLDGLGVFKLPLEPNSWRSGESVTIGIRLVHVELQDGSGYTAVRGVVNIVENLGGETYLHVEVASNAPFLMVKLHGSLSPSRGERVTMFLPADKIYLFDSEGNAIPVKPTDGSKGLAGLADKTGGTRSIRE